MSSFVFSFCWIALFFLTFELKAIEHAPIEYVTAPFEFSPKIWRALFDDKPVVLLQKQKAEDGAIYYILEKFDDPHSPHSTVSYYLKKIENKVYLLYKEDKNEEFPIPPLTNMGIPWDIAVKIEKVNLMHKVDAMGMKEASKWVADNIAKHRNVYFYTPEFIEAAKRLKILPKNYKLPPLLPKEEIELEKYLSTKITPKLIEPE
ncbi:hypothetical protein [Methylacidiphilum caldifontis]|uniref:Uncharacterized protein n=1 Tax=Methylacidiphilum caldifontis TaxID=2795386 RepID=A0A4Y8PBS7_9BACT|nr:hypothetical protein [Methylacidiphilum caldifontis]QSR89003.1 hypothetical protein IT6_01505 [Methylacidiphilum caldifontis]TFE68600.1 hypothetical protein A7Q10_08095 [Methylacidiphilum caldifontis]